MHTEFYEEPGSLDANGNIAGLEKEELDLPKAISKWK
jgi:hypothetical protein